MGLYQTKKLLYGKGHHQQNKQASYSRENIFVNDISDKGLTSKIHKELTHLHTQKANNPIKKWVEDMNKQFSKEEIHMANRHMKRCSTLLIIRKMQIKTTMRYHFTLARTADIEKARNSKYWQGYGERGTLLHCWQECKLVQPCGKQYGGSSKN